jgi:hypothetical protein
MPSLEHTAEVLQYNQKEWDNDIELSADLAKKAVLLQSWARTSMGEIREKIQQLHLSFMTATALQEAHQRALPLLEVFKVQYLLQKGDHSVALVI